MKNLVNLKATPCGPVYGPITKECSHCQKAKPLAEFNISISPFHKGICRECEEIQNDRLKARGVVLQCECTPEATVNREANAMHLMAGMNVQKRSSVRKFA